MLLFFSPKKKKYIKVCSSMRTNVKNRGLLMQWSLRRKEKKTYQQQQSCHNWKISLITRHLFHNLFNGTWIYVLPDWMCVCVFRVILNRLRVARGEISFCVRFIVKLLKFMIQKEFLYFYGYNKLCFCWSLQIMMAY